tara:strand:+ start:15547 stop:16377 length:831 start_codon:yes stop_codon:yes gene_type:complete
MNAKSDKPITEQDAMDATKAANRELEDLKERLSFVTRHSFRTPLTVIDGTARRLGRHAGKFSPDEVRERADVIRQTVDKMVELVEHSIELTNLAACIRDFPAPNLELSATIQQIVEEYQLEHPETNLVAWLNECPSLHIADRRLVELLLEKFLAIGVELVTTRGRLDLTCWSEKDWAIISLKAVFEARALVDVKDITERLDAHSEDRMVELDEGVNLKLIRMLIEQHGGELDIDKGEDRIEFEIRLPVVDAGIYQSGPLVRPVSQKLPEPNGGTPK